jgi:hypothetical protein
MVWCRYFKQGILTEGGRLRTLALLIMRACSVKMVNNVSILKGAYLS